MEPEYIGYIKTTKSGKFRCVLATLHDVGEPDGDKLVYDEASSELFDDLVVAQQELLTQCNNVNVNAHAYTTPIKRGQSLFESELS